MNRISKVLSIYCDTERNFQVLFLCRKSKILQVVRFQKCGSISVRSVNTLSLTVTIRTGSGEPMNPESVFGVPARLGKLENISIPDILVMFT